MDVINAKETLVRKTSEAILDATNLNFIKSSGRTSDLHDGLLKKLSPWLKNAKYR